ncbi:PD-(D/E)XK nuclease family protein [Psychrobacter sp. LV10R520-6]|uniref:PDDEXK-like family protein n=1 Tax=Psychrobacter sp. LV10R520-6 TaxID=1415574 RepID=UPI0024CAF7B0|nr:PD-(D/E)XK nuclease family protein [Psychrobacter sp. LV10R520-6]SNT69642.1 PD-(D/E)XK nuclease superfamily protein [Psychrobacter sp. LV10R520-6]
MSAVKSLINEVSQKLSALETAQALYSRQLSPDFNTFDYINTDELGLSRILASLLDPKGSHAQQGSFLSLFVEYCLPTVYKENKWQGFLDNIDKTDVFLEEVTGKSNSQRRMDIYLRCQVGDESYGICIENKPYAGDQFEQLKDYAIELDNRKHKAWHLIYLSEYQDVPSEYSIKPDDLNTLTDNNQFSAVKFSDLIGWLKACQVECQNHSVSEFIAQLIKFIQKQFMGIEDMNEDNAVLDIIKKNAATIDASIKVSNTVDRMKKELMAKLKIDLLAKCKKTDYELDISYLGDGKSYERINLIIPGYDIGYICFEFQNKNFDKPCLGIKFISAEAVKTSPYTEKMKSVLNIALTDKNIWSSSLWPAGYYFQPQDWKGCSKAWLMINEGTMADKILDEMDKIFSLLKDNNLLIQ